MKVNDLNNAQPGTVVGDAYEVGAVLARGPEGIRYAGRRIADGKPVVLVECFPGAHAERYGDGAIAPRPDGGAEFKAANQAFAGRADRIATLADAPAEALVDRLTAGGTFWAVVDPGAGVQLAEWSGSRLRRPSAEAIATLGVRLATSLQAAHAVGLVHGTLTAHAVRLTEPADATLADFLPGKAEATASDDVSALAGLLYTLVSGRPAPPAGRPLSPSERAGHIVPDDYPQPLLDAIDAGLSHGTASSDPAVWLDSFQRVARGLLARSDTVLVADRDRALPSAGPPPAEHARQNAPHLTVLLATASIATLGLGVWLALEIAPDLQTRTPQTAAAPVLLPLALAPEPAATATGDPDFMAVASGAADVVTPAPQADSEAVLAARLTAEDTGVPDLAAQRRVAPALGPPEAIGDRRPQPTVDVEPEPPAAALPTPGPVAGEEPEARPDQPPQVPPDSAAALTALVDTATDRAVLLDLLALGADKGMVSRRLTGLGYVPVTIGGAESWVLPGQGEPFRDCDVCPILVVVPAGDVAMDIATSTSGSRIVTFPIPSAFAVGRFEVTRNEFAAFAEATGFSPAPGCFARSPDWQLDRSLGWRDPGFLQADDHPVACVSWHDAGAYLAWLSERTGQTYRLLSDPEWHHLAVAPSLDDPAALCATGNGADESARDAYPGWTVATCRDGYATTAPGGRFIATQWGVHDLDGNLWEWVETCAPAILDTAFPPLSCPPDAPRILRGGSFADQPTMRKLNSRLTSPPGIRDQIAGFRVARDL